MSGKYVMHYPVSKVEVNLECMRDFVYQCTEWNKNKMYNNSFS